MPAATLNANLDAILRSLAVAILSGEEIIINEITVNREEAPLTHVVDIRFTVTDRLMYDIMQRTSEEIAALMDDMAGEEDDITAVERPSSHSITVAGVNNLTVRYDKEQGLFRLESVCPSCGRRFERQLRGFVTKDLVTTAHELGFKLGEHLERHQTFGSYLQDLQRKQ